MVALDSSGLSTGSGPSTRVTDDEPSAPRDIDEPMLLPEDQRTPLEVRRVPLEERPMPPMFGPPSLESRLPPPPPFRLRRTDRDPSDFHRVASAFHDGARRARAESDQETS